ncbi:synaptonemal complex central element protein 3 [Eucyclogobius newberryi]|uniref:synaptonemal complex central element protein 3 n=1 Tax=Eucyclogobius newberryi TaxID=166745 RepID=UPI003B5A5107
MSTPSTPSTSSSPPGSPRTTANSDHHLELNKDVENVIEELERMSVQLTCLAYDMVAMRTNPELVVSIQKLQEAYQRCKDTILGGKL